MSPSLYLVIQQPPLKLCASHNADGEDIIVNKRKIRIFTNLREQKNYYLIYYRVTIKTMKRTKAEIKGIEHDCKSAC